MRKLESTLRECFMGVPEGSVLCLLSLPGAALLPLAQSHASRLSLSSNKH